jgi:hypothetical protein
MVHEGGLSDSDERAHQPPTIRFDPRAATREQRFGLSNKYAKSRTYERSNCRQQSRAAPVVLAGGFGGSPGMGATASGRAPSASASASAEIKEAQGALDED